MTEQETSLGMPDLIPLVLAHREAVQAHRAAQAAATEALRVLDETGKAQQAAWDVVDRAITAIVDASSQLRRDWHQTERR